jgi:hypothetical protein
MRQKILLGENNSECHNEKFLNVTAGGVGPYSYHWASSI